MPARTTPKKDLRAFWKVYASCGYNAAAAGEKLGIPESTARGRVVACQRRLKLQVPKGLPHRGGQRERGLDHEVSPHLRQRLEDRVSRLETEKRALLRQANEADDFRQAVFGLTRQAVRSPQWIVKLPRDKGVTGTPILFTSDLQWGEVIKKQAMGGINEFNKDVASRRYRMLIEKTIELSIGHMVNPKYDGLILLRGGDMISGEIHADLRESNDLQAAPAVKDLVEHECAGIEANLRKFGKVHVISVPGNHGRMTEKPQSKGGIERNLDTLSAWWLESLWKKEPRVTFYTPESGDALFKVYGYNFLLTHGDRIGSRGGHGFIGAVATITRGMKKVADFYSSLGTAIDLQFVGHFHTALELEYGFSNGSLPGMSEYARDGRMSVQPPKQWLLFAHPQHMISARWPILLEPRPRISA